MKTQLYIICMFQILNLVCSRNICGPRRKGEQCVSIRQCPKILSNFTEGALNPEVVRKLQRITCGFDGNDPKICCPETALSEISKITGSKHSSYIDLKSHLNVKLLPDPGQCGKSSVTTSDYIFGGKTPALGSFPWLSRIGYTDENAPTGISYFCGGSVINNRYILTAAHCCTDFEAKRLLVTLGEHDALIDPEYSSELGSYSKIHNYKVQKILIHPNYNPETKQNDIALLRLESEVHISEFIKPICLPFFEDDLPKGSDSDIAEIAGWGRTKDNVTEGSEILQTAQVPIMNRTDCQAVYRRKTSITQNQICAGGVHGQDSCDGDSGGPLMLQDENLTKYFLVGIVSYGPSECGIDGYPGIYTFVKSYADWILDSIER